MVTGSPLSSQSKLNLQTVKSLKFNASSQKRLNLKKVQASQVKLGKRGTEACLEAIEPNFDFDSLASMQAVSMEKQLFAERKNI